MKTALYYKGTELVTKEEHELIVRMYGEKHNYAVSLPVNETFDTGIDFVVNILLVIQNNRQLKRRDEELKERIAKKPKMTESRSYSWRYVEEKILFDLVKDAIEENGDESFKGVHYFTEFKRLYKIPYIKTTEEHDFKKALERIESIEEPKHLFDIGDIKPSRGHGTCFKEYYVVPSCNVPFYSFKNSNSQYVAKIYNARKYVQVYVYDYFDSDKALQCALGEAFEEGTTFKSVDWDNL